MAPRNTGTLAFSVMRVKGSSLGREGAVLYDLEGFGQQEDTQNISDDAPPRQEVFGASGWYARPPVVEENPTEVVAARIGDERLPIAHLDRDSINLANAGLPDSEKMPAEGERVLVGYGGASQSFRKRPGSDVDDVVFTLPYARGAGDAPSKKHVVTIGEVGGQPSIRIESGEGPVVELVGNDVRISGIAQVNVEAPRVNVNSPDVRVGPGAGRRIAGVGDMVIGSVSVPALVAAGFTYVPATPPVVAVPVISKVVSGSPNGSVT